MHFGPEDDAGVSSQHSNTQSPAPGVAAERQRFEATFAKLSPGCDFSRAANDTYANRYVEHNWQGWNAALKASAAAVPVDWEPLEENPRERQMFDQQAEHWGVQTAIATCLSIWASMSPGGSYAAQCAIMANEVAKLYTAPPLPAQVQETETPERNNPISALSIRLLVAAGHVSQEKADEAFRLACQAMEAEAVKMNVELPWVSRTERPGQPSDLEQIIDEYVDAYEMLGEDDQGRDCYYTPNDHEKGLLKDAIMGLLADTDWDAAWGVHIDHIVSLRTPAPGMAPDYGTYTTEPGESLMGIALRQLKDEKRWREIAWLNVDEFPDIGPHDYYTVGTELRMPPLSAPHPSPAPQAAGAEPSPEQITEWAERHDIRGSAGVLRTIVDDARSLHLASGRDAS